MTLLGYLGLGVAAGILGSLLGLGGGILIVPGLTLLFGLPIKTAIATSVVAVVTNSLAGSIVYIRQGFTHIKLAMILEITTTLGALAGGLIAVWVSGRWLYGLFALVALYIVYAMRRPPASECTDDHDGILRAAFADPATGREVQYGVHRLGAGVAASTVAGISCGNTILPASPAVLCCRKRRRERTGESVMSHPLGNRFVGLEDPSRNGDGHLAIASYARALSAYARSQSPLRDRFSTALRHRPPAAATRQ